MDTKDKQSHIQRTTTIVSTIFLLALLLIGGIWIINKLGIISLSQPITKIAEKLFFLISVIVVVYFVKRLSSGRFFKLFYEPEEQIFYSKLWSWTLYGFALFIILFYFGVSLGNLALLMGILATGFAFAVRELLLSFFVWLILLRKKPFKIGDYIEIGAYQGKVIHIGTFYVLLDKTPELPEDFTRVPNRLFLEQSVVKLGTENIFEQLSFPITSTLTEDPSALKEIEKEIKTMINNEYVAVYYDINNHKLLLQVEYLVKFAQRKQMRTDAICVVTKIIGDKIKFDK